LTETKKEVHYCNNKTKLRIPVKAVTEKVNAANLRINKAVKIRLHFYLCSLEKHYTLL